MCKSFIYFEILNFKLGVAQNSKSARDWCIIRKNKDCEGNQEIFDLMAQKLIGPNIDFVRFSTGNVCGVVVI